MSQSVNLPLIAILRGLRPENAIAVCQSIIEQGFSQIEVPLNSPDALRSISMLVERFGEQYLIGAGTVTHPELAESVIATGAKLIVSPNLNTKVIQMGIKAGCTVLPGVMTPSEAFVALDAGASGLKIFPANALGLGGFKALMSVLPKGTLCYPVGGVNADAQSMRPFIEAGAAGFGIGASLFTPQMSLEQVAANAKAFVQAYNAIS